MSSDQAASQKLTPRRARFVEEYLIDLNASAAGLRAGYSHPDIGRQLVLRDDVKAAIDKALSERAARAKIDADYVLNGLQEVAERCMQRVGPVRNQKGDQVYGEDEGGNERPLYTFDAKGANRAFELLGKHLKLFADRVEFDVSDRIAERIVQARQRVKPLPPTGAIEHDTIIDGGGDGADDDGGGQ